MRDESGGNYVLHKETKALAREKAKKRRGIDGTTVASDLQSLATYCVNMLQETEDPRQLQSLATYYRRLMLH